MLQKKDILLKMSFFIDFLDTSYYNNIELNSVSVKTKFYADSLRWNQKSEQLVTGKSDVVKITFSL